MRRKDENLISNGIQHFGADMRRPLRWDDQDSPSVISRPMNIRQIVSLWGRLKAAWAVFTTNAYAVRWYNEENAHLWEPDFWEVTRGKVQRHSDYVRSRVAQLHTSYPTYIGNDTVSAGTGATTPA